MNPKSFIALSVIAVVLLSGSFISLAAADDSIEPAPPDASTTPNPDAPVDEPQTSPDDGATLSPDDPILYSTQDDNSTLTDRNPVPEGSGAEDTGLISTQTAPDNTVPIAIISVVIAIVAGAAIGVFYYHKKSAKV